VPLGVLLSWVSGASILLAVDEVETVTINVELTGGRSDIATVNGTRVFANRSPIPIEVAVDKPLEVTYQSGAEGWDYFPATPPIQGSGLLAAPQATLRCFGCGVNFVSSDVSVPGTVNKHQWIELVLLPYDINDPYLVGGFTVLPGTVIPVESADKCKVEGGCNGGGGNPSSSDPKGSEPNMNGSEVSCSSCGGSGGGSGNGVPTSTTPASASIGLGIDDSGISLGRLVYAEPSVGGGTATLTQDNLEFRLVADGDSGEVRSGGSGILTHAWSSKYIADVTTITDGFEIKVFERDSAVTPPSVTGLTLVMTQKFEGLADDSTNGAGMKVTKQIAGRAAEVWILRGYDDIAGTTSNEKIRSWWAEDPDGQVTQGMETVVDQTASNGSWAKWNRDRTVSIYQDSSAGAALLSRTREVFDSIDQHVIELVVDDNHQIVAAESLSYRMPLERRMILIEGDEQGLHHQTDYTYYDDTDFIENSGYAPSAWQSRFPAGTASLLNFEEGKTVLVYGGTGQTKTVVRDDGGWEKFESNGHTGATEKSFRPWSGVGGATAVAAADVGNCRYTKFEKLLVSDGGGGWIYAGDKITESIMGETMSVSETTEMQWGGVTLDGVWETGSSYSGDAFNLPGKETETTANGGAIITNSFSSESYGGLFEGSLSYSDSGTASMSITPEYGTWNAGTSSFAETSGGSFIRHLTGRLHPTVGGTHAAVDGLSDRTESIEGPDGIVFERQQVFVGGAWETYSTTKYVRDGDGRITETWKDDSLVHSTVYNADLSWTETDAMGVTTQYSESSDGLTRTSVRQAIAGQAAITTTSVTSISGLTTANTTTVAGGGLTRVQSSSNTRDLLGRTTSATDSLGRTTGTSYSSWTTKVQTNPDLATLTTVENVDGSIASMVHSNGYSEFHSYSVQTGGLVKERTDYGQATSTRWAARTTDGSGRTHVSESSGPNSATLTTTQFYDATGRLTKTTAPGVSPQLTEYNDPGEAYRFGYDLGATADVLDLATTDTVSESVTRIVKIASEYWRETTRKTWTSDTTTGFETNTSRQRLGIGSNSQSETEDDDGNTVTVEYSVNRAAATSTRTSTSSLFSGTSVESYTAGRPTSKTIPGASGTIQYITYNALGELEEMIHPKNGTTTIQYDTRGRQWLVTTDVGTTEYAYYADGHVNAGQIQTITDGEGATTHQAYDGEGRLTHTWGSSVYPTKLEYDAYGNQTKLHTYRSFAGGDSATLPAAFANPGDVTEWIYDFASGLLTNKIYADTKGTDYTYYDSGLLKERIWERGSGLKTTYGYNGLARIDDVDYSDSTPDVARTFDRAGRPLTVAQSEEGTRTYDYTSATKITYTGGMFDGITITESEEAGTGRFTGQALALDAASLSTVSYGYHATTGSLETASISAGTAQTHTTYGFHPVHGGLSTITTKDGTTPRLTTTFTYGTGGLLNSLLSVSGSGGPTTGRSYTERDATGRIKKSELPNRDYWTYGYDLKGQVTSGARRHPSGDAFHGLSFGFAFDEIGNRTEARREETPGFAERAVGYTPNAVNQYSEITTPGTLDVLSESDSSSSVTVNSVATLRQGDWFAAIVSADNSSSPVWKSVVIDSLDLGSGPGGVDRTSTATGNLYLASATVAPTHDEDGNLKTDGRWQFGWDAENRLITMTTLAAAVTAGVPVISVEHRYDADSRRIATLVTKDGTTTITYYLWSGWTLLGEFEESGASAPSSLDVGNATHSKSYLWGLDWLGGGGSGNVGNLVASVDHLSGSGTSVLLPAYDGNGNIISLTDDATGELVSRFDYNLFGSQVMRTNEILSKGGSATPVTSAANAFKWGFSTKAEAYDSGLLYYGYRFYDPVTGRWPSRDPIGEEGGVNLYGFVNNNGVNRWDYLGTYSPRTRAIAAKLPLIPQIMRNMGLQVGPAAMEKWFSRRPGDKSPVDGLLTMKWALGFHRASEAADKLKNFESQSKLAKKSLLAELGRHGLLIPGSSFDHTIGKASSNHKYHYQHVKIDHYGELDDFGFAVGKAAVYVVAKGVVEADYVCVQSIGIYLKDDYRFIEENDQTLGVWDFGEMAFEGAFELFLTSNEHEVSNRHFKAYQNIFGKGEDYESFSDIYTYNETFVIER